VSIRCSRLEEDVIERFLERFGALPEYREVHIAPDDTRRADMEARLADPRGPRAPTGPLPAPAHGIAGGTEGRRLLRWAPRWAG
jgi:hypothetical protein